MNLAVNFLPDLAKFKLCPQNLVLLLLQCCFSFFKSCLQFFLLNFQASALLVKLMNGTTTISKLIKKVSDFICQVLIFPFYNIQLLYCFIPCCLEAEQLTVIVTTFLLAGFSFSSKIIYLCFPFTNNLVKIYFQLI